MREEGGGGCGEGRKGSVSGGKLCAEGDMLERKRERVQVNHPSTNRTCCAREAIWSLS